MRLAGFCEAESEDCKKQSNVREKLHKIDVKIKKDHSKLNVKTEVQSDFDAIGYRDEKEMFQLSLQKGGLTPIPFKQEQEAMENRVEPPHATGMPNDFNSMMLPTNEWSYPHVHGYGYHDTPMWGHNAT
jgi:hypothetical protein